MEDEKFLWKVLAIVGINLSNCCLNPCEKCLSFVFKLFSFIFIIHWSIAIVFHSIRSVKIVGFIYYMLAMQSFLIYIFLKIKVKSISGIVQKLFSYNKRFGISGKKSWLFHIFVVSIILLPAVISFVLTAIENRNTSFYTFGYIIENEILHQIIAFYDDFIYYSTCTFTAFVSFSLSRVFYRWGNVLRYYNRLLKSYFNDKKLLVKNSNFLKEYFFILKTLQKLNQALSYPSFIVVFCGLGMIFISLYSVVLVKDKETISTPGYIIQFSFNCLCGFLTLVSYALSCSMIPDKLTEIRLTVQDFINICGNNHIVSQDILFDLQRIEKAEIVYISSCGIFQFSRKFIFSALGTTLTYVLLAISIATPLIKNSNLV